MTYEWSHSQNLYGLHNYNIFVIWLWLWWNEIRHGQRFCIFWKRACIANRDIWKWAEETPRTWFQIAKNAGYLIEDRLLMTNSSATIQWRWVTKIIRNRETCLFLDPWGGSWKIVSWDSNCWSDEPYLLHALLLAQRERDQGPSCYRAALIPDPFCVTYKNRITLFCYQCDTLPQKVMVPRHACTRLCKRVIEPQWHVSKTSWLSLATSHIVIIIRVPSHHNRCQRDVMLTQEEGAVPCCSCSKKSSPFIFREQYRYLSGATLVLLLHE